MAETAERAVYLSVNSCINNKRSIEEVQNLSETLILMADEIEDRIFELIFRFQPVASDLRVLKSYMKIAYDFTRYGRYALDITQIFEKLGGLEKCEEFEKELIIKMSDKVLRTVHISIGSVRDHNFQLARTVLKIEEQVDEMYFKYLDTLVEKMPVTTECVISSILVARYLERIADHAAYICESVVYLATGQKEKLR
ncbi:MAG: phosphate signaling complex PhoU family protein [Thermoproteota archaeon]